MNRRSGRDPLARANHPYGELGGLFAPVSTPREDATLVRRLLARLFMRVRLRGVTRAQVLQLIGRPGNMYRTPAVGVTGLTSDEAACLLGRPVLAVTLQTAHLVREGFLGLTGESRENEHGVLSNVLRAGL